MSRSSTGANGAFLRMRPRLWREKGFRELSHAAMGLYLRLHSYLDDRENDEETGWEFRDGDLTIVSAHAAECAGVRAKTAAPDPLNELVELGVVECLARGRYRLLDVQSRTHQARIDQRNQWRAEKSAQRGTQVSGTDTGPESG